MEVNVDISAALRMAARVIQSRLEMQAPVRTGKLKKSIRVYVEDYEVLIEYVDYGIFTNYGTGPYYNGRYGKAQPPDAFAGYRKGTGGIQAQNWTSITSADEEEMQMEIEKEIERQIELAIEKATNQI